MSIPTPWIWVFSGLFILIPIHSPAQTTVADTLNLYGGPGTLEGKFQTAADEPDQQGWTTSDGTALMPENWQISTFNAANLDTLIPDNHAWWCGDVFEACHPEDAEEGYGNNWDQSIGWEGTVLDPGQPAEVRVTAILNLDTEVGYDYVRLVFDADSSPHAQIVLELDGIHTGYHLDEIFIYGADEYLNTEGLVRTRIQFRSDAAWSDEDCLFAGAGAVQIDNLQVTISQDGQPDQISPLETCEPGEPRVWSPVPALGYGNYAQLWTGLTDEDPQADNVSPQWAFIDDGDIQPGAGPTLCYQGVACYGPGSCVVDIYGGLTGFLDEGLRNHVTSPAIALPPDAHSELAGLLLSADAYFHSNLLCDVIMTLKMDILSTADPAGESGWTHAATPIHHHGGDPEYRRIQLHVPHDGLVPDARFVKIQITADDIRIWWCHVWLWSTPAPYFDNVRLQAIPWEALVDVPTSPGDPVLSLHPNPFNPSTTMTLNNPREQMIQIRVYDLRGSQVGEMIDTHLPRGRHVFQWDGKDDQGRALPSGEYFFRVNLGDERLTKKALLVR